MKDIVQRTYLLIFAIVGVLVFFAEAYAEREIRFMMKVDAHLDGHYSTTPFLT